MGLDMSLTAKKYVSRIDWREVPDILPEGATFDDYVSAYCKDVEDMFPKEFSKYSETGAELAMNVASWRKANAIHGWFVRNIQNGEDDCKEYYVHQDQLRRLLDTVNQVLDGDRELAEKLLPTSSGFFFGNQDYDEYYYETLRHTQSVLSNILSVLDEQEDYTTYDFYYSSSW